MSRPHRRVFLARWAAAGLAVFLGGCANLGIGLVNTLVPSEGYRRETAIAYGPHPRQALDVYVPTAGEAGARPVVLFFYGGSWQFGDRGQYKFLGEALASRGVVTVIADYRLYPEVKFPAFMEDSARLALGGGSCGHVRRQHKIDLHHGPFRGREYGRARRARSPLPWINVPQGPHRTCRSLHIPAPRDR